MATIGGWRNEQLGAMKIRLWGLSRVPLSRVPSSPHLTPRHKAAHAFLLTATRLCVIADLGLNATGRCGHEGPASSSGRREIHC